jgi:tRNA pseudouridine38-40 synthase
MPRFKLTIEYAGTRFSGWQIQKNARTIQGELDRAVRAVTGRERFEFHGAGRTDAGVHALAQVAHLDIATTLPPATLLARLNDELPADINVLAVEKVGHRFHARRDAVARAYLYQISRRRTAFAKPYVWWVREPLDLAAIRDGAARFEGFHDFRSFSAEDDEEKSTTVALERVQIVESGALVLVRVEGSHFIWRMVRRMVGVLVEIGRGGLAPSDVGRLLRSGGEIPARLTAPASGLFLERVSYTGDRRDQPIVPAVSLDPVGRVR